MFGDQGGIGCAYGGLFVWVNQHKSLEVEILSRHVYAV